MVTRKSAKEEAQDGVSSVDVEARISVRGVWVDSSRVEQVQWERVLI